MNRLLLDQGLPRTAAVALREAGGNVEPVSERGMSKLSERAILDVARAHGQVVVTLDADFHALLALANESAPSVIRIRREALEGRSNRRATACHLAKNRGFARARWSPTRLSVCAICLSAPVRGTLLTEPLRSVARRWAKTLPVRHVTIPRKARAPDTVGQRSDRP